MPLPYECHGTIFIHIVYEVIRIGEDNIDIRFFMNRILIV